MRRPAPRFAPVDRRTPRSNGTVHPLRAAAVLALALILAAGCVSAPPEGGLMTMEIAMLPDGAFDVGGRTTDLRHLARQLRAEGAGRTTAVKIRVDERASRQDMRQTCAVLNGAGYERVLFVTARTAESELAPRAKALPR